MHTVLLCFVLLLSYVYSYVISGICLPIFFRVTSLEPVSGKSLFFASEVTLKDMGIIDDYQSKSKRTKVQIMLPDSTKPLTPEPMLTHWGRVMHVCISEPNIIGHLACAKPLSEPMVEY